MHAAYLPSRRSRAFAPASNLTISWVVLLGCALAHTCVAAQQIYKWTDSQGETHYSDHAPTDQAGATVNVPKTPPSAVRAVERPVTKPHAARINVGTEFERDAAPGESITGPTPEEARRAEEEWHQSVAPPEKPSDQSSVDKCHAQRNTDCDPQAIKRREEVLTAPPPAKLHCRLFAGRQDCELVSPPPPPPQKASDPPSP
jgi:hypothetical protein